MFCRNNINRSIRWIFLALTQGMLLWYSSTVVVGHCGILSSFSEFSSKTYDKNEFEVQWREAQNFKLSQDSLQGFKKKNAKSTNTVLFLCKSPRSNVPKLNISASWDYYLFCLISICTEMVENLQNQFGKLSGSVQPAGRPKPSSFLLSWSEESTDGSCFHGHSLKGILQEKHGLLTAINTDYWLCTDKLCNEK